MNTLVYIRRENGELGAYQVENAVSYASAINLVKKETGVSRALAVVEGGKQ